MGAQFKRLLIVAVILVVTLGSLVPAAPAKAFADCVPTYEKDGTKEKWTFPGCTPEQAKAYMDAFNGKSTATPDAGETRPQFAGRKTYWAYTLDGTSRLPDYDVVVEDDGIVWQPIISEKKNRVAHKVSIELAPGNYEFDGVECKLHLDVAHNKAGVGNPVTAQYGNSRPFTVKKPSKADTNWVAWGIVTCRKSESSGFKIRPVNVEPTPAAKVSDGQGYGSKAKK